LGQYEVDVVDSLWTVFLGLGAVASIGLAIAVVRRWPLIGLIVAGTWTSVAWEAANWGPLFSISTTNVFIPDLIAVVFALTAILQSRQLVQNLRRLAVTWILVCAYTAGSLLAGLMLHDSGTTFTEFRPFFYVVAVLSWSMSIDFGPGGIVRQFGTAVIIVGWALCVVTVVHVAQYGLGGVSAFVQLGDDGSEQTQRGLTGGQALMLLLALLHVATSETKRRTVLTGVTLVVFAAVLIVTEQRTVWIAGSVALVALVCFGSSIHRRRAIGLGAVGVASLGLLVVFDPSGPLVALLGEAVTNAGTYDARQTSWIALVGQGLAKGPFAILFGTEFGAGFGRYEGAGRWVEYAPHNMYVFLFLRVGLLGLLAFVLGPAAALISALRAPRSARIITVVLAFAVYGWAYQFDWYTAPILGWAIVAAVMPQTERHALGGRPLVMQEAA